MDTLKKNKLDAKVFIVVNGSDDDTEQIANKLVTSTNYRQCALLHSKPGKIEAQLTGLQQVGEEPVWFVDADCIVEQKCPIILLNQLEKHAELIVAGGHPILHPSINTNSPLAYLNLSRFFPETKIVTDVSYSPSIIYSDPQPNISPEREEKLKPFFHGACFMLRNKKYIPNISPAGNIPDDIFWSEWILYNYGGVIRTMYNANVYIEPRKTPEELLNYRERIKRQIQLLEQTYPQYKQLEKAITTHRDREYIKTLSKEYQILFDAEIKIYSTHKPSQHIKWHGEHYDLERAITS